MKYRPEKRLYLWIHKGKALRWALVTVEGIRVLFSEYCRGHEMPFSPFECASENGALLPRFHYGFFVFSFFVATVGRYKNLKVSKIRSQKCVNEFTEMLH